MPRGRLACADQVQTLEAFSSSRAVNFLECRTFEHHPVMLEVALDYYRAHHGYIMELNGLMVPANYDCDMFNDGKPWGGHRYFFAVPSRWLACYVHQAYVQSGLSLPVERPELPIVDEEYSEHVSVFQSVLRAKHKFVMAELGPRWGTWTARAAAFMRRVHPMMPHELLMIEANEVFCEAATHVMAKNSIADYELLCTLAGPENVVAWANGVDHIDLIDVDIQVFRRKTRYPDTMLECFIYTQSDIVACAHDTPRAARSSFSPTYDCARSSMRKFIGS
jgi:hypothetical protein